MRKFTSWKNIFWNKIFKSKQEKKPKLSYEQKELIKEGQDNGLSEEIISLACNPEFSTEQIKEILCGGYSGLSVQEVSSYAKPENSPVVMEMFRIGMRDGWSTKKFEAIIEMLDKLSPEQKNFVVRGVIDDNLDVEQIAIYAKPEFNFRQMGAIEYALGYDEVSIEQVKKYAKPEYSSDAMSFFYSCLSRGYSEEKFERLAMAVNKLNKYQIRKVEEGLQEGLSVDEILIYAKPDLSYEQMEECIWGLYYDKLSAEQVSEYANPEYNRKEMGYFRNGMKNGCIAEQMKQLISKAKVLTPEQQEIIFYDICTANFERKMLAANPKFDSEQTRVVDECTFRCKLNIEQISIIANLKYSSNVMWMLCVGLKYKYNMEQLEPLITRVMELESSECKSNAVEDIVSNINDGFREGFSIEMILLYAKLEFNVAQQKRIIQGFEEGLSIEQVSLYANPKYNFKVMDEIRLALKSGRDVSFLK